MENSVIKKKYDVVVVGGGLSGICAAIAAARHGAKTALVHDRPSLGGNASSEIKMHICGAACGGTKKDLRETGIIEEILLENRRRNPAKSFYVQDTILWEKVNFQENLSLYLNTRMTDCETFDTDNSKTIIKSVSAIQMTTEKSFRFEADIFVDATGDGYLANCSGAMTVTGRESKQQFGEKDAKEHTDSVTLGSSLMFKAKDMKKPTPYVKPEWAYSFSEEDLKHRLHQAYENDLEIYDVDSGFWWIELGGTEELDTINDAEKIRDELLKIVHGVWDHIKNSGEHGAENYALDWIQFLPGKRESRRIVGEYALTENDVLNKIDFYDAVVYGGWPMDIHAEGGIWNTDELPTNYMKFDGCYSIPYRSYVSKNICNLFAVGRIISATHIAFGSTRVMATCAIGGQAVGTAAAMAIQKRCLPLDLLIDIKELQQRLLKDDCYIPNIKNEDPNDLAKNAFVKAGSETAPFYAANVINGVSRNTGNSINCYECDIKEKPWLEICFDKPKRVSQIHIKFDSNLSNIRDLQISLDKAIQNIPFDGPIKTLVKDYDIELYKRNTLIKTSEFKNNYLRFVKHVLNTDEEIDRVRLKLLTTNGDTKARIFEIRVY